MLAQLKKIIILTTVIYPLASPASWLCKEAASHAQGNTFYACGHATEVSLADARNKALEAAKSEFEAFCNDSEDCKDRAYNISPMRTDCSESNGKYSCYRGLEYTILKDKRTSMKVNKNELSKLIKQKEKELNELEENLQEAIKLQQIDRRTEYLKEVDAKEVEIEQLDHMKEDYTSKAIEFKFVGLGTPLKDREGSNSKKVTFFGVGAGYEFILFKNLSLAGDLAALLSSTDDSTNSSQKGVTFYNSHFGLDGSISLPFRMSQFTIAPNLGILVTHYKSVRYEGANGEKHEGSHNMNFGYYGLGLRYGHKLFIEVEPRKYFDESRINYSMSLGLRIDY